MTPDGPQILSDDDLRFGGGVALLLLQPHLWMHRRVENVRFVDERSLERRVSLDLTMPGKEITGLDSMPYLPLALLSKELLVGFDLSDEGGSSVPTLTKEENGPIALAVLLQLATDALGVVGPASIHAELTAQLLGIAEGEPEDATALLDSIEERAKSGVATAQALTKSWYFMSAARNLASRFLLLCPIDGAPGDRRVVKFSYVTGFERPTDLGSRLERAASLMGWIPAQFTFNIPAVGESASYHFEFTGPSELQVLETEAWVEELDSVKVVEGVTTGQRAHVYLGRRDPETDAYASVWVRPPRTGLTRASLVMTAATFAVLLFFLIGDRLERIGATEPVAIMLSVPALVSTFIVRPGEHRLATDLLAGIRATVGISGLAAFIGAVLLVGQVSHSTLLDWWRILAIVAGLCFLSSMVAFMGLSPPGRIGEAVFPVSELEENGNDG